MPFKALHILRRKYSAEFKEICAFHVPNLEHPLRLPVGHLWIHEVVKHLLFHAEGVSYSLSPLVRHIHLGFWPKVERSQEHNNSLLSCYSWGRLLFHECRECGVHLNMAMDTCFWFLPKVHTHISFLQFHYKKLSL